jgi:cation diffusion facilitator family transporter
MVWSLCIAALLLGVKFAAYVITQSSAVLSDALESIVNVAASGFALYSVWLSIQPADASHPYGHGKAEAFSAGFEGGLIVLAGAAILWQAAPALWSPAPLTNLDAGLVLVAVAGGVNLGLGYYLIRTAHRTGSLALQADGHHVVSDSITTAGVLIGLGIVRVTGWAWVDPVVAVVIGLHLLRVGSVLVGRAVANLMDQADPAILAMLAAALQQERRSGWVEVHKLRSWRAGDVHHVDFHLTLPRFWDLEHAHRAEHAVTEVVRSTLTTEADVIVHLDPCVPACCESCNYEPCPVRATPSKGLREWTARLLVQTAQYQRTRAAVSPGAP